MTATVPKTEARLRVSRRSPHRRIVLCIACVLLGWVLEESSTVASAPGGFARRMSFHNRLLLNRAAVSGLQTLEVMVLVAAGRSREVIARVEGLGGRVRREDASVGYLRLDVPTEKLVEFVATEAVDAYQIASFSRASWYRDGPPQANADMYRAFERPVRQNTQKTTSSLPMLPVEMSRGPGYTADEDAGVGEWHAEHPTFDGRGVTIAILEPSEIEFAHPMLVTAKSLDGRDVPKLAGILNTLDEDVPDATRVHLNTEVRTASAWKRLGDRTYALPRAGTFRFGLYIMPVDINLFHQFGVLVDTTSREIWIDANGNGDFRDEMPVPDVNERFEPRLLKLNYPTPSDLSFVVAHGRSANAVHVYVAAGAHHTMTTSVAAGSRTTESLAFGVAPSARVLLVRNSTPDHRLRDILEGFLEAARRPEVDLLSSSQGVLMVPDTAGDFVGSFMRRIVAVHQKLIFLAAGNAQLFLSNVSSFGDAFSVGGSMGAQTHATLFGGPPIAGVMVHPIGAAGPALDGAFKPDFLAPMQRLAADIYGTRAPTRLPTSSPRFQLPPGYQISCCTSASAPYAAGLAALLMSAARQDDTSLTMIRLQRALRVGAQFLDGWPAHQQGNGVLHVASAWRELRRQLDIPTIRVTSSVVHPLARYAARGTEGVGLFERDGWSVGMSSRRVMRFRRESGAAAPISYRLSWTGNDGTFSTYSSITLPIGSDVTLSVGIAVRTDGAHSAILNLHDPATDAIIFRTLATIVAAERLAEHGNSIRLTGSLAALRRSSHYVVLPERGHALQITLEVHKGTVGANILPSHGLYPNYYDHVYPLGGRPFTPGIYHVVLPHPASGMWTVDVSNLGSQQQGEARSTSGETAEYTIALRLLSVTLRPHLSRSGQLVIDLDNRGAAPKEPVIETSVGTLRSHVGDVPTTGPPAQLEVIVPEHASTLDLRLRNDKSGDDALELYLYDCTLGECFSYDFTLPATRDQRIVVRKPNAGRWVAAVNPAPFPMKAARFVVEEIITGAVTHHARTGPQHQLARRTWRERIDIPAAPHTSEGATPVVLCELVDAAMNREEEAHPWETRVNVGLSNLAGRRPAIGTAIHRLK